jgi:hypothetical protein
LERGTVPLLVGSEARQLNWHIEVVDADHLRDLLGTIRTSGGTITCSRPCPDGYSITYVTLDG